MTKTIKAMPLTAEAFAPYGDVIEGHITALQRDEPDMFYCDTKQDDGTAVINIVQTTAKPIPANIPFFEKHPMGSQAFIPACGTGRMLIVVAGYTDGNDDCDMEKAIAFVTDGTQGVQFKKAVWHGALYSLDDAKYAVIDRGRNPEREEHFIGTNCDYTHLEEDSLTVEL